MPTPLVADIGITTVSATQPGSYIASGILGSFKASNSNWYILYFERTPGIRPEIRIYKSTDNGATFSFLTSNANLFLYASACRQQDIIYFAYIPEGDGSILTDSFDMVAETFGGINDPGITINSNDLPDQEFNISATSGGDILLAWTLQPGGDETAAECYAKVYSSGSWGSALHINAGVPRGVAENVITVGSNFAVLWSNWIANGAVGSSFGVRVSIFYTPITAGVLGSAVIALLDASKVNNTTLSWPVLYPGIYDSVSDAVAFPIAEESDPHVPASNVVTMAVLVGTPVSAPVFTKVDVHTTNIGDIVSFPRLTGPIGAPFTVVYGGVQDRAFFSGVGAPTAGLFVLLWALDDGGGTTTYQNSVTTTLASGWSSPGLYLDTGVTTANSSPQYYFWVNSEISANPVCGTPIQVSSDAQFRQSASEINFDYFQIGSNLYQVLVASQGEAKIGVFKRAKSDVSGAWVEKDSASSPSNTHQSGNLNVVKNGTKLAILYLLDDFVSLKIVEFDTATDTYGAPTSTLTIPNSDGTFGFVLKGSTYVVIGSGGTNTYVVTNTGGTWSSITNLFGAPTITIYGAILDVFGKLRFIGNQVSAHLDLWTLDNSLALTGTTHTFTNNMDTTKGRPSIVQISSTSYAVGYITTLAGHPFTVTVVTNTNTSPVYTPANAYVQPSADEEASYGTLVLGLGGALTAFFVRRNIVSVPVVNEVDRTTISGGVWAAYATFYDAVADPPAGGTSDVSQIIRSLNPIAFGTGWSLALTMNTVSGMDTLQTGFFIDPCGAGQTLELVKSVVGGTAVPTMWLLTATGPTPISGAGDTGVLPVDPGDYVLTESVGPDGYVAGSYVCVGGTQVGSTVTIAEGDDVVCTITNTFGTPPFQPSCPSPIYVVGTPYSSFVTVTGGVAPFTFAVHSGSLPTGLSLNASTGEISGTPSAEGPFTFVIEVTDSTMATADTSSCSAGRCPGTRSII